MKPIVVIPYVLLFFVGISV